MEESGLHSGRSSSSRLWWLLTPLRPAILIWLVITKADGVDAARGSTTCSKGFTCRVMQATPMAWTAANDGTVHVGGSEHVAIDVDVVHVGRGVHGDVGDEAIHEVAEN